MTAPIRVLLVDDHALLRAGFRTILDTQPDIAVVGEASTGAEAVAQAAVLRPDVITMDVQMPDMDGIEATRRLVADPSVGAAIAIVTTFDRDDYLYQALEAGASGFLLKNAGAEDLISAVRARGRGRHAGTRGDPPRPHPLRRSDPGSRRRSRPRGGESARDGRARGAADRAGGRGADPARRRPQQRRDRTCAVHRRGHREDPCLRILQKLGARDRVQAVVLAHRMGLA